MPPAPDLCRPPPDPGESTLDEVRGRLRGARRSAVVRSREAGVAGTVSTVLLDVGGVVIPTLFESTAVPGFPPGPLGTDRAWESVERGTLGEREYWAEVARGRPEVDLAELWRACSYVRAEMREAVAVLAGSVRVVAFTNDLAHWFGAGWEERFPILTLFDGVLEASRLGASKPDPEAFRRAARAVSEPPGRCLLVDDLEVNCAGARQAGMQALRFDVRQLGQSVSALLRAAGLTGAGRRAPVFRLAGEGAGERIDGPAG